MYRTHPKWILVLVGSMVALINAILFRTGWGYNPDAKFGYPSDFTTRILWHIMSMTGSIFVLILPWHVFTHHPVAGKTDAKTKILMFGTFLVWFIALIAGQTNAKRKYQGPGHAIAQGWATLTLYGLTPIFFPHPPNRSQCKWTAAYPVVLCLLFAEIIWDIPNFGTEVERAQTLFVLCCLMLVIPTLRLAYDRKKQLEHDVGYMLLLMSFMFATPIILWQILPREMYLHRKNRTTFIILYFCLLILSWFCYWLPEKFCNHALPEKSHPF